MAESGELIGPYRLVSLLGKGAMGEVWRAKDERLDRYVAVKVLPAGFAGDVERRARMLREAKAAAAIRHANVVTLFDIVSHEGDDILVMELVEGRTLSEVLRQDGAPALEVGLRWIEGVADALVAAHGRGILHRDIKAANIMVTPEGIKVLDFGLAKLIEAGAQEELVAPAIPRIALDETMPSGGTSNVATWDATEYRTHAGQLLGTPLYMAPEQIVGAMPDARSEVFSVGVLAHEIVRGKPPYSAATIEALFAQIALAEPPVLDDVPASVAGIVRRALAKDPSARYATMAALRDAVALERRRLFAPRARRWPLAVIALLALGAGIWAWAGRSPPVRPGDEYVHRALEEYDLFYNDKALSSLRAALAVAPDHPRALAYLVLFGGSDAERAKAVDAARHAHADGKDRALVDAAVALVEHGPQAARATLSHVEADREIAFWTAELDYRAANYRAAHDEYRALLADPTRTFRGRIYDHDSSVLLYLDEPTEALRIGTLYRDAFPGEADAVGVYATTLAAAGQLDLAIAAAEDALRLSEGEDTLAGLAKVVALAGDRPRAKLLYQRALDKAGPNRRPLRRAALGFLHWIDGELDLARAAVAPCLSGGADATARERGACLFVAGVIDPSEAIAAQLDTLGDLPPTYGSPHTLAALIRARSHFFGGACLVPASPQPTSDPSLRPTSNPSLRPTSDPSLRPTSNPSLLAAFTAPVDFYAAYHLPFFSTWQLCEHAALLALTDRAAAHALLQPTATRAPNRTWLLSTLARYQP